MKPIEKGAEKGPEKKQRQYDVIMLQIREMIFNDNGGLEFVVKQIGSVEGGPVRGVGYTAAMLIKSVKSGLEGAGKKVDPAILKAAFMETVANLVQVAISAKLIPPTDKQAASKQAAVEGAKVLQSTLNAKAPPGGQPPQPGAMQQPPQGVQPGGLVQQQMGAPQ